MHPNVIPSFWRRVSSVGARLTAPLALLAALLFHIPPLEAQVFRSDDPVRVDRDDRPVQRPRRRKINDYWDFVENTFLRKPSRMKSRAVNINTLGEVPDSSWYTNRIGIRELSRDELVRGPDRDEGPAPGGWTVVSGKSQGISPGFRVRDSRGVQYFVKFDPISNPEMATGAEIISTKFFHALGYNVPENYLVELDPSKLSVAPEATVQNELGQDVPLTMEMTRSLLDKIARKADGRVRAIASKQIRGDDLGPFKFFGTRRDDANDVFPHEHRRELRGYYIFCSWLNHDDSRSINTQDFYVGAPGEGHVRHYLIDFGSTLGSGSIFAQKRRPGNEYMWEAKPTFASIASLGLWRRPWVNVEYPEFPSIGRFEADYFQPEKWKPEYPNAAFREMDLEDAFWAARQMLRFRDGDIEAVVKTARFSNPLAEAYLTQCLIKRRDKMGNYWLRRTCPLDNFRIEGDSIRFDDLLVVAGYSARMAEWRVRFESFDNGTGARSQLGGESRAGENRVVLPAPVREASSGSYFVVHFSNAGQTLDLFLRREMEGLRIVGLQRK